MAAKPKIKILIVDDHPLWVDALRGLLAVQPRFMVAAEANSAKEALYYADLPELDLILMDINLSRDSVNGIDLTRQFRKKYPEIKVLVCSMHEQGEYVQRAKQAGANGYLMKTEPGKEIMRAVYEVIEGNEIWPSKPLPACSKKPTPTELQVLKYIARGMTTGQIAVELGMVEANVSAHRHNIRQNHGVTTQAKLVIFALKCMELYGIPPDLDLSVELNELAREFSAHTSISLEIVGETGKISNAANMALYRVAHEALRNIRQHATAYKVSVQLKASSSGTVITICDDGAGFNVDQGNDGSKHGLYNLRKILEAIGGELFLASSPATGSKVVATISQTGRH
jgi:DNA-binding NarL/FixJ family response regulator